MTPMPTSDKESTRKRQTVIKLVQQAVITTKSSENASTEMATQKNIGQAKAMPRRS